MTATFSRDELLAGLPARRASTLLFAIEAHTARLVLLARQALTHPLNERTAVARERQFLGALAAGRAVPDPPTIQEIDRFAPEWAELVPADPALRAELTRQTTQKYRVPAGHGRRLRRALGVSDADVRDAYRARHGGDIDDLFVQPPTLRERVAWLAADVQRAVEDMPPFWTAYALTLTGTVGASALALPIAVADAGLGGGLVLLVVLGLVHTWTIAAMVEAVTRSGGIRYGAAYLGRLVSEYLGRPSSLVFTALSLLACAFALLIRYIGLSSALAGATGVAATAWAVVLFAACAWVLARGSLRSTLATTLLIGGANVVLLALLALIALPHVETANLTAALPLAPGGLGGLGVLFGVVLSVYARHIAVGGAAKVTLRRDPSGRSLLTGTIAATLTSIALYVVWTLAVVGTVPRDALRNETGTALTPLGDVLGPGSDVLGGTFAVLSMGVGSLYMALVLAQHVTEWLPERPVVPRRGAAPTGAITRLGPFAAGLAPVAAIFALVLWMLATGQASFVAPIAFVSALTGPVLSGVFPVLLLTAARRRGEYVPGLVLRMLDAPVARVLVFLLFVGAVCAYALVLWDEPIQRVAAALTATAVGVITVASVRRGSFRPRVVVELRRDRFARSRGIVTAVAAGRVVASRAQDGADGAAGERLEVVLPPSPPRELLVWVHDVGSDGRSHGRHVPVLVETDGRLQQLALDGEGRGSTHLDAGSARVAFADPPSGTGGIG